MKGKKLLAGFLSAAMLLGTVSFSAFAEGDEAAIGETAYATVAEAVTAAQDGDTITILTTVENASSSLPANKSVTFKGADENVVLKMSDVGLQQSEGKTLTFENLIMEWPNNNYTGIKHSGSLVYNKVTIKGQPFLYAVNETFNDCKFVQDSPNAYNVWTYGAQNVKFNNCEFKSAGKSVLIYNEGTLESGSVDIENCTFEATAPAKGKAAVEIDSRFSGYNVVIDDKTTATGFDIGSMSGNSLYNIKDMKKDGFDGDVNSKYSFTGINENVALTVAGEKVNLENIMTNILNDKSVVQNGDVRYAGGKAIEKAIAEAQPGDTIKLLADTTVPDEFGGGMVNFYGKHGSYVFDCNGYKLTGGITVFNYPTNENLNVTIENADINTTYRKSETGVMIQFAAVYNAMNGGKTIVKDGTFNSDNIVVCQQGGELEIQNGTYTMRSEDGVVVYTNDGVMTIQDGTFKGDTDVNKVCAIHAEERGIINVYGGTFEGYLETEGNGQINIYGGTFSEDPKAYVADGYYSAKNADGTFSVLPAAAKVIDTANTTGATVKLNKLAKHKMIDLSEDATYQVIVKTAPKADAEAANKAIEENAADKNTSKAMYDISVVKTDSKGVQEEVAVTNQQVTLTLGETPKADTVKVYHVDSAGATEISGVTADGNKVSFIAPSFSTYAVTYTANSLAEDKIAKEVGVAFERIGDTSAYDIVLKARDSKQINRFMSADLTFDLKVTAGDVGYTVKPAANINLVDNNDGRYEFNLDGVNASGVTGASINIGTVTFEGTGTVEFSVKDVTTNIVNTAKAADNIVDDYTTNGDGNTTGKLVLNDENANGTIKETFAASTKDLTILIAFNNAIKDNAAAYQDMTLTISGSDLAAPIVTKLGSDNADVTFDGTNSVYTVKISDKLTQNSAYTVTVEGAGYRTARYTVTMTADKTLNFWNNVKSAAAYIEEGVGTAKTSNFLAGDIVKDGKINIYDLSAVVSYFGTTNATGAVSPNAKYDLNRDGVIDSKDVAYVLVSWGE